MCVAQCVYTYTVPTYLCVYGVQYEMCVCVCVFVCTYIHVQLLMCTCLVSVHAECMRPHIMTMTMCSTLYP